MCNDVGKFKVSRVGVTAGFTANIGIRTPTAPGSPDANMIYNVLTT